MSTEIALQQLTIPGVLTATSLTLPDDLSQEQWEDVGEALSLAHQASAWWIGDWLRFGQDHGYIARDRYDEAARRFRRLQRGTFKNCAWVAGVIESSRRRDDLDFAHHQEVASLPPAEQDIWLERASSAHWPHKTLRNQISKATRPVRLVPEATYDFGRDRKRQQAPYEAIEAAEELADAMVELLKKYDTETLVAIVDYYEPMRPDGWLTQFIREHVDMP